MIGIYIKAFIKLPEVVQDVELRGLEYMTASCSPFNPTSTKIIPAKKEIPGILKNLNLFFTRITTFDFIT